MSSSDKKEDASEGKYLHTSDKTNVPWYHTNIDAKLVPETRELLEKYSHIPPEQQLKHAYQIRDQAFAIRPYPCTGVGAFLTPQLCRLEVYPEILDRIKKGGTLIDFGCFIGHDLRRLVYDGAPASKLYGVDIVSHWEVGFDMFRDRDKFGAHFIHSDMLSDDNKDLQALKGQGDVIAILQVLHQWNWDAQVKACVAMVAYSKPGTLFVGNQIGHNTAYENTNERMKMSVWFHSPESFAKMMDEVGTKTGTKWDTKGRTLTFEEMGWNQSDVAWLASDVKFLEFAARRTE